MLRQPLFTTLAPLVLASASPRRQQMLQGLGLTFETMPAEIDETPLAGETPHDFVERMARTKARAVADIRADAFVLGADTVVTRDGMILGKPQDRAHAVAMLQQLSGRTHQVLSAICLCARNRHIEECEVDITRVTFINAPPNLLAAYVDTGEPMDKAGAYGIQGAGAFLVRGIQGSCANVIGLPIDRVISLMVQHGVIGPYGRH